MRSHGGLLSLASLRFPAERVVARGCGGGPGDGQKTALGLRAMAEGAYRIIDEPAPSALSRLAVNPFWIVLVGMLLSRWQALALLWFVFNGFALNSPTKLREIGWAAGALVIALAIRGPLPALLQDGLGLATFISTWPYIHILAIALLLTAMYRLFLYQYGSYQLFRYLREGLG
jgi:hypothetical protein